MEQYNNDDSNEKPRIKLPMTIYDPAKRIPELERQIINQYAMIEKLRRELGRVKADVENLFKSR